MSEAFHTARKNDHKGWYCPNGCCRVYNGPSEAERLRKQLATAQEDNERAWQAAQDARRQKMAAERSKLALRGDLTRAKNQLQKGNCPNCEERFDDLEKHIADKHPNFDLELTKEPEPIEEPKRGRPRSKSIITKDLGKTRAERKAKNLMKV